MKRPGSGLSMALAAGACLTFVQVAMAHPGHGGGAFHTHSGWMAGLWHPLTGVDHLLAMLASGLLAVRVGTRRALWVVPLSFVGLMLAGGGLAYGGVPLPGVEWVIGLSVIVLGVAVAAMPTAPLTAAAALVGLFAISHGHAHVAELGTYSVLPYMAGFSVSTLGLHAAAIGVGLAAVRANQPRTVRFAGGAIAAGFAVVLLVM